MANLSTMKGNKGSKSRPAAKPANPKPARPVSEKRAARVKTPTHVRIAARLRKAVERIKAMSEKVQGWRPDEAGAVEQAQDAISAALTKMTTGLSFIDALPSDYTVKVPRERKVRVKRVIEIGSAVRVRESRREQYEQLVEEGDLDGLVVEAQNGKSFRCKAASGAKLIFKGRDLEIAA